MPVALSCVHLVRCAPTFLVVVLLIEVQALAQDSWTGKQIMPKSEAGVLDIKSGEAVLGKTYSPALTVLQVQGDWLEIREGDVAGWVARGDVVLMDNAIEYFTGVIQQNPRAGWAYFRRGHAAMVQSKTDPALEDLSEALRLDPTNVVAYYERGIAWNQKQEYDKAIADFTQAIRLRPKSGVFHRLRGVVWERKKEYDKAIADYSAAIRIEPQDKEAYANRGGAWEDKAEYDNAIADYSEVIRLDPQDSMAFNNRGNARKHKEEYDNAIADFNEAIRLRPNDSPPYFNRGVTWHLMKEYDKAISDFDEVIRLDPQFNPAYRNRGDVRNQKGEYDNAIADFNEAIRLSARDAESYVSRGSSWRAKSEFEKALADYSEALRIDPKNARAHNLRAWLWATCPDDQHRDGRQAVESAKSACELTEWNDHLCVDTLAAAYAEVGDFDNAVKTQIQAIELAGEVEEYQSRLALYQVRKAFREGEPDRSFSAADLVKGNTRFAFDLYSRLRLQKQGDLFFSPYSISTALAMTYGGAAGDTQAQMAQVLRFPKNQEQLHAAFAQVVGRLQSPATKRAYQLHFANALWAAEQYNISPQYFGLVEDRYRAALKTVNFRSPEEARQAINHWVEGHTQRKIQELIKPGLLNPATPLVLTNAIYFKAAWAHKFDPEQTGDEDFFTTSQIRTKVRMMHQTDSFRYLDGGDFQLLELPYAREGLSMLAILPKQVDGLEEVEKSLSADALDQWTGKLELRSVEVSLPKFKTTAEVSLVEALESLGMRLPFDRQHADFSAMTTDRSALAIAAIEHQAFVDVNEEGTEAAAATAVIMAPGAGAVPHDQKQVVFRADHPFLYLIRENSTGSILFIGRVSKPGNN